MQHQREKEMGYMVPHLPAGWVPETAGSPVHTTTYLTKEPSDPSPLCVDFILHFSCVRHFDR